MAGFFLPVVSTQQCEYLPYKSVVTSIESFVLRDPLIISPKRNHV